MAPRHVLAVLGIVLVIGAIAVGLVIIGPPSEQRALRLDENRLADLRAARYAVDGFWKNHARLPNSLAELRQEPAVDLTIRDPSNGEEYGYQQIGSQKYRLCADFDRNSPPETDDTFWSHRAGRHCFELQPAETEK